MTEAVFRSQHSEIIEYYQYIEIHLKGICAALLADEAKDWFARLEDYDSDPLGKLLLTLRTLQSKKQLSLFSADDLDALDVLRESRNYWVHRCFSEDHHVIFKRGVLRDIEFAKRINADLSEAIEWDKKITEVGRSILPVPSTR